MANELMIPDIIIQDKKAARRAYKDQLALAKRQQWIDLGKDVWNGLSNIAAASWASENGQMVMSTATLFALRNARIVPWAAANALIACLFAKWGVEGIVDILNPFND